MENQQLSKEEKIRSILNRGVSFIYKSSDERRSTFPNEMEGWFYTFCLDSGQIFVANFQPMEKRTKTLISTFRPFNRLLPGLKEIVFKTKVESDGCFDASVNCGYQPNVQEDEKDIYNRVIVSKTNDDSQALTFIPLYSRALPIHLELVRCLDLKRDLMHHQELLRKNLIIQPGNESKLIQKAGVKVRNLSAENTKS